MRYLLEAARAKGLDRIAIAYAVSAWLVVQATAIVAPAYAWAPWVQQLIILAALLGLPDENSPVGSGRFPKLRPR